MVDGESNGNRESGGNDDDESDSDGVERLTTMSGTEYFGISRYAL